MPENPPEPWVPQTKEDWAEVFAMGEKKAREETWNEAVQAAELQAKGGGNGNGGTGDTTPPKRRTVGDILLGNKSDPSA